MHGSNLPKYVSKTMKKGRTFYRIRKCFKKEGIQVYQSPNLDNVLKVYEQCKSVNWNRDELLKLKKYYQENRLLNNENQYITPDDKGGYRIQKWTRGRAKYYGKTSTLEHARKIRDYLIKKGWTRTQYQKREVSNTKHIRREPNGTYMIVRRGEYYGAYKSFLEAIEARKQLKASNWDKSLVKYQRAKRGNINRYIQRSWGKYTIKKWIDGKYVTFGTLNTLEEAREERDFFESINWDWDMLDLY